MNHDAMFREAALQEPAQVFDHEGMRCKVFVPDPPDFSRCASAIGTGGCLSPLLEDGDMVFIDRTRTAVSGDLVEVCGEGDEPGAGSAVKRLLCVVEESGREAWVLASKYTPQRLLPSDRITGVVVAALHVPGRASGHAAEADAQALEYQAAVEADRSQRTHRS